MNKKTFNIFGWVLLLGMAVSWIGFGYSSWYILLIPMAYISFSISDGSIKKFEKIKQMSIRQVILTLFAFVVSVGIAFALIQLANYLINEILHLTGWIKTISEIVAVIFSVYPVKFTFGSVVYKVTKDLNAAR
ncbi:disulfide bond formation protein DsbD [Gracilibacillus caseinilyticus]|uniref:Disulfide bond formation protein DsbD n=1 Tax=Gracilibacillus caseinilyticus TaxID=2932256 RepID=A0ABY4EZF4_9BACI|nr:disulfide bond formation protein DsbD [Gracilibacillus caseinilyticus]UOQ49793.1 disulfide bond formation protein DsbD [Gracilibacillus caseinilyticus]